jgi:flavodoxin
MKKLVVFYSLCGNTKLIAETISKAVNADILELEYKNKRKAKGILKYFFGGREVLKRIKPELLPFDKNPLDYDLIFIGSPVWGSTYAPPLRTFFTNNRLRDKNIAFFCCYGGSDKKVYDYMKQALRRCHILGRIGFKKPLKKDKEYNIQKAKEWATRIINIK